MNNQKLNSLAVSAGSGDIPALWELKAYFHPFIVDLSESNRNSIASQEKFEDECMKIIDDLVTRFDPRVGNFRQLTVNFIKRRLGRCVARQKNAREKHKVYGSILSLDAPVETKDGRLADIDIEDRLATVESNLLLNEKIASLAGSDSRKLAILNLWTQPNITDSYIAHLLAQMFGGKVESHRKSVHRFKSECKLALANAA